MKTTEEILREMIFENKKEIKETQKRCQNWIDGLNHYQGEQEIIIKMIIKKVKKITLILSIATILNSIGIIILNLWR